MADDAYAGLGSHLRELALLAGGRWGIAFYDLVSGASLAINANAVFPGASIAKVGLLVEVARQIGDGVLRGDDEVAVDVQDDENARLGSGILVHLHRGLRVTIGDLCELAINLSDNVASNLLIERVGFDAVNATLDRLGLTSTRLNHRFADFVALRARDANPVTAADLASLFSRLFCRDLTGSDVALDYLRRCSSKTRLPYYLPEEATVHHKTGTLRGIVHDGGVIAAPSGAFILVCLSDEGHNNNVASQAIARMAQAAWRAFREAREGA